MRIMSSKWRIRWEQSLTIILLASLLTLTLVTLSISLRVKAISLPAAASARASSPNFSEALEPPAQAGTDLRSTPIEASDKSVTEGSACKQPSLLEISREQQEQFCDQLAAFRELHPPAHESALAVETAVHWTGGGVDAAWRMFVLRHGDIVSQSILSSGSWERPQVLAILDKMQEVSRTWGAPEGRNHSNSAVLIDIGGNVGNPSSLVLAQCHLSKVLTEWVVWFICCDF